MERERLFETLMGAVVLLVAIFFFNYAYSRSGWQKVPGYTLTARFDRADGLVPGSEVRVAGVRIGHVEELWIDPKTFEAVVKFKVANAYDQLPKDTAAAISTDGLFGGKHLALLPGGDEEHVLRPNDPITNTQGSVNLESLIGKFLVPSDKSDNKEGKDKAGKSE